MGDGYSYGLFICPHARSQHQSELLEFFFVNTYCFFFLCVWLRNSQKCVAVAAVSVRVPPGVTVQVMDQSKAPGVKVWIALEQGLIWFLGSRWRLDAQLRYKGIRRQQRADVEVDGGYEGVSYCSSGVVASEIFARNVTLERVRWLRLRQGWCHGLCETTWVPGRSFVWYLHGWGTGWLRGLEHAHVAAGETVSAPSESLTGHAVLLRQRRKGLCHEVVQSYLWSQRWSCKKSWHLVVLSVVYVVRLFTFLVLVKGIARGG